MNPLAFVGRSLRRQLLVGLSIWLLVVMTTAGLVAYNKAQHETDEIFSARLATSARVIDTLLVQSHVETASLARPLEIELPPELTHLTNDTNSPLGQAYETKLALQVWSKDNRLLIRSSASPQARLGIGERGFFTHQVEGERWHVFALESKNLWVEVAEKEGLRSEVVDEITSTIGKPFLIGVTALVLIMNVLVSVAIRPLAELSEKIASRKADDADIIALDGTPSEMHPIIKALNDLLGRIQTMLARERRFTDSAAHEMRTPLAALMLHAQNIVNAESDEDRDISLAQLLTGLKRTNHLVEQMLSYSRISSGNHGEIKAPVELVAELRHQVEQANSMLEHSELEVELDVPIGALWVSGYQGLIAVLINTLLENAIKYHNPEKPSVTVRLGGAEGGTVQLVLSNNMLSPLSGDDLARLSEPYFRPSQSQSSRGTGLGLAIASEIAKLHGWTLQYEQTASGEFNVRINVGSQNALVSQ